ncbi:hypothetical protein BDZ45DRAFT_678754 [Acephala macrosclerotiorum]|nr:hypothetical protein BDZ45DRAFT_678754 [Acephala macrosclerotiorum]
MTGFRLQALQACSTALSCGAARGHRATFRKLGQHLCYSNIDLNGSCLKPPME